MAQTKKPIFIAQHEYKLLPEHMEHPVGKSETVPDETMTIREIMNRHVSGLRIGDSLHRTPHWDDDADFDSEDFEEVNRMDIQERSERAAKNKQKVERLTKEINDLKQKKKTEKSSDSEQKKQVQSQGDKQGGSAANDVATSQSDET